ncbi:unnamed protein product [Adineta steineri]|uniref:Carbohydrate-binding domain-containing protein n=1 Tax=Adineta steineri TaxID=433720 RepID=A0A814JVS4_9BILA|nr:unnamed protein product [Adineta steineri]CAF1178730.1 unnamed protein product [Adineta steineri]
MSILKQILFIYLIIHLVKSDPINRNIKIDGNFDDWKNVPSYTDPEDNIDGTVYDRSPWFPSLKFPDCHDADTFQPDPIPTHVYNPNVNIVEFKIAHDDTSLYAYYRVVDGGVIGKTSVGANEFDKNNPSQSSAGRYYVIATVDIDNDNTTGYWLHGGAYHPTAPGFDGNFEVEFFNGSFNQDVYLDHAANNNTEVNYLKHENKRNQFIFRPAIYESYTEYIYWKHKPTKSEIKRCLDGPYRLPRPYSNNYICFTQDKAPGPFNGIISYSRSEKGNEFEMRAPFEGFLLNKDTGRPTLQLGMTIKISLSLETTEEDSTPRDWSSDTAATIQYTLSDSAA